MTVAPRALASTAANTGTEAGRSSAAAILRATTMLRKRVRERLQPTWRIKRRARLRSRLTVAAGSAPPMTHSVRDYSRMRPRGPIVEKRRLRLAPCDEALFIITTSPLDCPTRPRPSTPHHPAERRLVVPTATLANQRHTCASFARAVRCYRLYGDIMVKSAPDRTLFSARTCGGQRGSERSICDRNLDIEQHA